MLVFVRTKTATVELAERIEARGFACDALNGDMTQQARERTIGKFRSGKLDILIATDVAARGIDVPRISHVVNLDIPNDSGAYVHRIGRTGRAGRKGTAITFVTARESRLLRVIERATRSPIEWLEVPGREQLAQRRIEAFKQQMQEILVGDEELEFFRQVIRDFAIESGCSTEDAAAALAFLMQRKRPLQPPPDKMQPPRHPRRHTERNDRGPRSGRFERHTGHGRDGRPRAPRRDDSGLERYRIQVGRDHGATAGHIVGAIANEAGLNGQNIGRIQLYDTHSTIDLPRGMHAQLLRHLQRVRVLQQPLGLRRDSGGQPEARPSDRRFKGSKRKPGGKLNGPGKKFKGRKKSKSKR
jgi:ATP-dependent RNA helicase DeaD